MFAYALIYITTLFSIFYSLSKSNKFKIIIFFIITLVFSLVLGLRSEYIGVDTPAYYSIFNTINYSGIDPSSFRWEPGYIILNKLIYFVGGDAKYVVLSSAVLTIFFIMAFLRNTSPNFAMSLILYIGFGSFFYAFNAIRQAIAMAIICFAFQFLYNNKKFIWFLLFLLAFSFHYSASVFLLYFTPLAVKKPKVLLISWLISLLFLINGNLIVQLVDLLSFLVPSKYISYTDFELVESFRIKYLLSQIFFIGFYLCYKKLDLSFNKQLLLLAMYGVILSNTFAFAGYLSRLAIYFTLFYLVAIPITINYFFKGNNRYLFNSIAFIVISAFYFRSIFINSFAQYPYSSWLALF